VFQTEKWDNEMYVEHNTNPHTGEQLGTETIRRLHKKYGEWLEKEREDVTVNDILLTPEDIKNFKEEIEETGEDEYEHVENIIFLSDDEDEIEKIKAIYKHLTGKDFIS